MAIFTDAILYIEDFSSLVSYINENFPDYLARDENGNITQPPVITGFARTPAKVNGNRVLVYVRLREDEVEQWQNIPYVEILAQSPFEGKNTANSLYESIFNDSDKDAKYKSVYDYSPYQTTDEETGQTITIHPPKKFGILAGA